MKYIKPLFLTATLLICLAAPAVAETKYVAEIREITLRSGPGTEYKITAFIPTGETLTVLEEADTWSKVQTRGGKEGWVLSRFIQAELPNGVVLQRLQKTHELVVQEKERLVAENDQLKSKNQQIEAELAGIRETASGVQTDYDTLKKESADFIALKDQVKAMTDQLSDARAKAGKFESDLTALYNDQRIKWFLVGAGVLLLGIVLGYSAKPQRRRSTLR